MITPPSPALPSGPVPIVVGREDELVRMREWYAQALAGQRRVIFVAGEAGIGKTTLVGAFLDSTVMENNARTGRGQCIEQYGSGEPYMPVLDAKQRRLLRRRPRDLPAIRGFAAEPCPFPVLADYRSYVDCQSQVAEAYCDERRWARMSIAKISRMGNFSSDLSIREYHKKVSQV